MTEVLLECDAEGRFKGVAALGHADFGKKGTDIVCAAESMILNTVLEFLQQTESVVLKINKPARGQLAFRVESFSSSEKTDERLKCAADFLKIGFRNLSSDYPENVQLREKN